jgi:DNA recombination-dependent growth factor C
MYQTTVKIEGFVTVTSERKLSPGEVMAYLEVETKDEYEASPVIEVVEREITSKEISSHVNT